MLYMDLTGKSQLISFHQFLNHRINGFDKIIKVKYLIFQRQFSFFNPCHFQNVIDDGQQYLARFLDFEQIMAAALGIILMLVAGGMYGMSQWRYHEQDVVNEKLAEYAVVSNEKEASKPPEVDWASLKALNPEVVGWVQIPGTVVNYPVFQASDNDKYLYTNYDGGTNLGGQVFLDYENTAPGMVDGKSIIYGHHLKNGAMFKAVADMDKQAYFDSIETVWYATENETFELEPLFVFYTNPDDGEVRTFKFDTPTALRVHLTDELSRAVAADPLAQGKVDLVTRVMVLSTCNYIDGQGRTILVCGLKSETAPVEIANVVSN